LLSSLDASIWDKTNTYSLAGLGDRREGTTKTLAVRVG
jgi:hypothetical protein